LIELLEKAYNSYLTKEIHQRVWQKLSTSLVRSKVPFMVVGSERLRKKFQNQTRGRHSNESIFLPEETSLARLLELAASSQTQLAFLLNNDARDPRLGVHTCAESRVLNILQPIEGVLSGSVYRATSGHLPNPPGFSKGYIVASSRRTGSTMLCHLLEQTDVLGFPEEYISRKQGVLINTGQLDPDAYLRDVFSWNTTANGVFGLKVHWQQFFRFQNEVLPRLSTQTGELYQRLVEDSQYIHLRRRDKIRQAVSDWRAHFSGVYHLHHDDGPEIRSKISARPGYDYQAILKHLKVTMFNETGWLDYFKSQAIKPIELFYEDLVDDPNSVVERLSSSLSVKRDDRTLQPTTVALADQFTDEICARFQEDLTKDYGTAVLQEVLPGNDPRIQQDVPRPQMGRKGEKTAVLVTLATADYLDKAKAFFSSAFHNGAWDGDYLLLAHEVADTELDWFHRKGIVVKPCDSLYPGKVGGMHPSLTSKYHLFTPYFRQWNTVVYSDLDAIVRAPLQRLKEVRGFAAVDDWSPSLHEQMVDEEDISCRGLDLRQVAELKELASQRYRLANRPFCAGFFVFSTDIIEDDTREKLVAMTDQYEMVSKFGDQLALNFYFYGRWQKLNPTFNVLVRQKSVVGFLDNLYEVETRWGKVEKLNPYILHIFDPKPWSAESGFHLEWLSFLHRAEETDFEFVSRPSKQKLQAVANTESQIRFRQWIYDLLEGLGELKLPVIRTIHYWHWRLVVLRRLFNAVVDSVKSYRPE
jgi:LPS sulfotransferase NodH/lipopolysaccharide biosynthesis glycosyltransferase